ncbi:carboxypeptidase regulatory-like domain-containing protein [Winogradskyella litoriviva]|uniref:Carboxypeptidase regulatory-like domain-containing protein n=1 Tax=Winogradskyella litoriviva TaxID=1220182 RepID=A0ABX2E5C7_9FLAO|nr:carboxypeptidase-like regulatory domain-containing protein [Winogradskyella litoriviva]NRD23492.1 carboxypeptidase regulatory-like domain-containing protein [Winogradskyella litoriviva]
MKKSIAFILLLCLAFSCSEKNSDNLTGDYTLSGKFVVPNGLDPISKAKVMLYEDNIVISETLTDSEGNFIINNVFPGDFEIKLSKGLFSTTLNTTVSNEDDIFDIDLSTIEITEFPNIAVVTGNYDNIETVLYNIGLVNPVTLEPLFDIIDGQDLVGRPSGTQHTHSHANASHSKTTNNQLAPNVDFGFGSLIESPTLLANYDIIFLNCGLSEYKTDYSSNLTDFVANGGLLYATDYAFVYLNDITNYGTDYISFREPNRSGQSLSTVAEVLNTDLLNWMTLNFNISTTDNTVTIDQFLDSWQPVASYNEDTVIPWLHGPVEYTDGTAEDIHLAYTFNHGDGGVLYSSFHTKNSATQSEAVERSIQYLVFELASLKTE